MLRKRISSILVAGVVAISMTGCNVKDTYKQLLEQELQRIESTETIEYELPQMEQDAKEVESKVKEQKSRQELYNEVNQGKVEQEQPKQQSKNNKSNDKTPEQQVKQEQPKQQVNDKEQVKQQEINDEEQVKSGHTAYDESDDRINDVIDEREDYWRTDGDVPNNEPTTEESNEPKVQINVQDIQESQEYVEQFNN